MNGRTAAVAVLLAALRVGSLAAGPTPRADETGMVPGDLVLGNMSTFPGHAGIYLGKWRNLPEELRRRYDQAFQRATIYSCDEGLRDTFLVVDSYAPRVSVRSFAEQFTEFFTGHGTRRLSPRGALKFEGSRGGAIEWQDVGGFMGVGRRVANGLPLNDPRRWRVVEEALRCSQEGVRYDSNMVLGIFPVQWAKHLARTDWDYKDMTMDCITMAHVVYWRGAGINLSNGGQLGLPLLPGEMDAVARKDWRYRAVMLEPVFAEAVLVGKWRGEGATVWEGKRYSAPMALGIEADDAGRGFLWYNIDPKTLARLPSKVTMRPTPADRTPDDRLVLRLEDGSGRAQLETTSTDTLSVRIWDVKNPGEMTAVLKKVRSREVPIAP